MSKILKIDKDVIILQGIGPTIDISNEDYEINTYEMTMPDVIERFGRHWTREEIAQLVRQVVSETDESEQVFIAPSPLTEAQRLYLMSVGEYNDIVNSREREAQMTPEEWIEYYDSISEQEIENNTNND